ncbi:permease [Enterovibrio norvegicus]|uniref:Permease n=1 Tax=Enterovibrio norvegicus TaxID=188144 RepID=A0A2N7LFH8_9GAMM|nr:permease [Enterovibrio norvegicus]PMN94207.1 permease [Enterovibrio norvegicus]
MNSEFIVMLQDAAYMFVYLAAQLTVLFFALSYLVGLIAHFMPPEKVKNIMGSNKGYLIAAMLAVITPFCSATTIPFLKGLFRANVKFGSVMVFLIASPLLNPTVLGLLIYTFNIKVAALYFITATVVAIVAGWLLQILGFEDAIKTESMQGREESIRCSSNCGTKSTHNEHLLIRMFRNAAFDFKRAFPYLMIGVSIGAFVYGFVPTEVITAVAGPENPFAVPVAAIIGVPLYITVESLIALSSVLLAKGMGMGALIALIIGSAGASITEVILLKSLFKNKLIIAFLFVVFGMAVTAGYMYELILA